MQLRAFYYVLFICQLVFVQNPLHGGTHWEPLGPFGGTVQFVVSDGNTWVYAGMQEKGLFRSGDAGRTWQPINTGLSGAQINSLCIGPDGRIYCAGAVEVAVSGDNGSTWTPIKTVPWGKYFTKVLALPDSQIVLLADNDTVLYRSRDNGRTWKPIKSGIPAWGGDIREIQPGPFNAVIVGTSGQGIYQIPDQSDTLVALNYDLPKAFSGAFTYYDCAGYVVLDDGTIILPQSFGIYFLAPRASTWRHVQYPPWTKAITRGNDSLMYAYGYDKIFASADTCSTWKGFPASTPIANVKFFVKIRSTILISSGSGFWRSDDNAASWSSSDYGIVRSNITAVYAPSTNIILLGTGGAGILRSTDQGKTWWQIGLPSPYGGGGYVVSVKSDSKRVLYAASMVESYSGVWTSADNGATWARTTFRDSTQSMGGGMMFTDLSITAKDEIILSGYELNMNSYGGMFVSSDAGNSWSKICAPPPNVAPVSFTLIDDTLAFIGTGGDGVYRSTNRGATWKPTMPANGIIRVNKIIRDSGTIMLGATYNTGILRSTDMGLTWSASNAGLALSPVQVLSKLPNGMVFVGTEKGGYVSQDHGRSWTNVTSDAPFRIVNAVCVDAAGTVYVGTDGGLYRTSTLTGFSDRTAKSARVPRDASLSQNFPNPFNPSTTISFSLASTSFVSLKIFDVMGRETAVLVSEQLQAGAYSRQWNAANMPSGIYFYRLQTDGVMQTKKILLVR